MSPWLINIFINLNASVLENGVCYVSKREAECQVKHAALVEDRS